MGVFEWRSIALVASIYLVLAIAAISLAYPKPGFEGLVAPPGFRVILYNGSSMLAVLSSDNSSFIYWSNSIYSLGSPASSACYNGSKLFVVVGDGSIRVVGSRGVSTTLRFSLDARLAGVTCRGVPYAILTSNGSLLVISLDDGTGFKLNDFSSNSVSTLQVDEGVYIAGGNRVIFIGGGGALVYELPRVAVISGLAVSHDGLVAYGTWDDKGLIYRFSAGDAILLSAPGRITSVDALACTGYRCVAVVRPHGDWPILVEFNNWRYVSHAKVVAVKPFVYHSSGASDIVWISGELVDLGVVVVGASSTKEAIIGFNSTHGVLWTEGYIIPAPRLSKIKIYPSTGRVEVQSVKVNLSRSSENLEGGNLKLRTVEAQVDRIGTLITLTVVTLPVLVYLYTLALRGGRSGATPPP